MSVGYKNGFDVHVGGFLNSKYPEVLVIEMPKLKKIFPNFPTIIFLQTRKHFHIKIKDVQNSRHKMCARIASNAQHHRFQGETFRSRTTSIKQCSCV